MDIIKSVITLLKKPKTPLQELEDALASIDITTAERDVDALERQRHELLISGTDSEVTALDAKISAGNLGIERLAAMRETLTQRIADMKSQGAEDARRKAYAAAQKGYAAGEALLAEYEQNARAIVAAIGKLAELDQAIDDANSDLPTGVSRLPTMEARLRGLPGEPEQEVGREVTRTGWFYEGAYVPSGAVPDQLVTEAKITGNIGEIIDRSRGHATPVKIRLCQVVKITKRDTIPPIGAHVLSRTVVLPGVRPGSEPIWGDVTSHANGVSWEDYDKVAVIAQASEAVLGSAPNPAKLRAEPMIRSEVRIIPLGIDEQVNG